MDGSPTELYLLALSGCASAVHVLLALEGGGRGDICPSGSAIHAHTLYTHTCTVCMCSLET